MTDTRTKRWTCPNCGEDLVLFDVKFIEAFSCPHCNHQIAVSATHQRVIYIPAGLIALGVCLWMGVSFMTFSLFYLWLLFSLITALLILLAWFVWPPYFERRTDRTDNSLNLHD